MKKVFKFLKHVILGLRLALNGGVVTCGIVLCALNIYDVTQTSGWSAVGHFVIAAIEFILSVLILREIGEEEIYIKNWKQHKREQDENDTTGEDYQSEQSKPTKKSKKK